MSFNLTGIIDYILGLLLPEPVREPIPVRVDRRQRRR